jgi:HlyD family secretion protein
MTIHALPDGIGRYVAIGLAGALVLVGGVGGWAATSTVAGAVVAPGTVVVDGHVKAVQHPTGGVVGELRVREGDHVEAGDVLIRLDDTITRASLGVITSQLDELAMRIERLKAERDDSDSVAVPASLAGRATVPAVGQIIAGERKLFESRRSGRVGQKAQLNERINQLAAEIDGLEALLVAKSREFELASRELKENRSLWERKLITLAKFTALEREEARIGGERAQLVATIARTRAGVAETQLQIVGIERDHTTEVMKDLRDAEAKVAELTERRAASEDVLKRIDIRAPRSGMVHELTVHTVGGVIGPGDQLMQIVPDDEALVVEARVAPREIDQVHPGQPAFLRFTAFDQRTTPEFKGTVVRVAADVSQDPQSGEAYYTVGVRLADDADMRRQAAFRLVPGMSAEVYCQTIDRTPLSYLVKPLRDQIERAFRER